MIVLGYIETLSGNIVRTWVPYIGTYILHIPSRVFQEKSFVDFFNTAEAIGLFAVTSRGKERIQREPPFFAAETDRHSTPVRPNIQTG